MGGGQIFGKPPQDTKTEPLRGRSKLDGHRFGEGENEYEVDDEHTNKYGNERKLYARAADGECLVTIIDERSSDNKQGPHIDKCIHSVVQSVLAMKFMKGGFPGKPDPEVKIHKADALAKLKAGIIRDENCTVRLLDKPKMTKGRPGFSNQVHAEFKYHSLAPFKKGVAWNTGDENNPDVFTE